ncbi:hypothetical protein GF312_14750 [Candidatus Poribacteria bacterium]|nr:hypothetical protein [Candidatus Poribacteria bacterium]
MSLAIPRSFNDLYISRVKARRLPLTGHTTRICVFLKYTFSRGHAKNPNIGFYQTGDEQSIKIADRVM